MNSYDEDSPATRTRSASKFQESAERLRAPSSMAPTDLGEAKGENRQAVRI
jgi:hypothetical protein